MVPQAKEKGKEVLEVYGPLVVASALILFLAAWSPKAGVAAGLGAAVILSLAWGQSKKEIRVLQEAKAEMANRVDLLTEEMIMDLPLAVVAIDGDGLVAWHNPQFARMLGKEGNLRGTIRHYLPDLHFKKGSHYGELLTREITWLERTYRITLSHSRSRKGQRILFFEEITELQLKIQKHIDDRPVLGLLQIDNFTEVMETLEEEEKPHLVAEIDKILGDWSLGLEAFLRKYGDDRYILLATQGALKECRKNRFDILDRIRGIDAGNKLPVTLSVALGVGEESILELGRLARSGLELALGRGGDQVVVKSPEGVQFFGGSTEATEKRTKVRARVVASSLERLISEATQVFIMGHETVDLDSLGSALGLARAALAFGKPVRVVVDYPGGAVEKLTKLVGEHKDFSGILIGKEEAVRIADREALVIVVDTHKPSLLMEPRLVQGRERVVIIDHHRRGEEIIEPNALVYLESYASSTCELVAELIQYMGERVELGRLESTALLAGITVDTKNFIFQTGVRTFEAASYLRRQGADPALVQQILRDNLQSVIRRAAIIQNTEIYYGFLAVGIYPETVSGAQVVAAQGADTLLNIEGVRASFVLCSFGNGVTISARSNGEINVQVLMEKLGGGGHLTIAGTQLENMDLAGARKRLLAILENEFGSTADKDN